MSRGPHPDSLLSDEDLLRETVRALSWVLDKAGRGMDPGRSRTPLRRRVRLLRGRDLDEDLRPMADLVIRSSEAFLRELKNRAPL